MSMFPHTVTVYNVEQNYGADFNEDFINHITVLHGVLLDATKAINVRSSGIEGADAVNLYIPRNVVAVDALTGAPRQYISPMRYWALDDKSNYWTLSFPGNGGTTFFVKGEVSDDKPFETISMIYDGVYNVTKVDDKDFGGDMAHFEVGGA
jgi:hypothetical protein